MTKSSLIYRKWTKPYRPGEVPNDENFMVLGGSDEARLFPVLKDNPHPKILTRFAMGILSGYPLLDVLVFSIHGAMLEQSKLYYKLWRVR